MLLEGQGIPYTLLPWCMSYQELPQNISFLLLLSFLQKVKFPVPLSVLVTILSLYDSAIGIKKCKFSVLSLSKKLYFSSIWFCFELLNILWFSLTFTLCSFNQWNCKVMNSNFKVIEEYQFILYAK